MLAIAALAVVNGAPEILCRPRADAGGPIRCDIRRDEGTEWRRQFASTCVR